ncbi:hypothetical protein [Roseobacter sinensis]|uniref:Lipoprotein n=1 Tax=Roseobacter sinensis TaxID=2931391 RepID=A0ABT3BG81_9RHOB|nr:hypothetical protein [Roseobacter sp. WL0113]MCV3272591.1 hypothetical protein [Roseobacter sp. WL0113]
MTLKTIAPIALLALTACASVATETRTPATLQDGFFAGERYEIRTRLIEGPEGNYEQTSVVYRGLSRTCIPDSPQDCERAARGLIEEYDEFIFRPRR